MRALIQRTTEASVTIDQKIAGEINNGFVILLGVTHEDSAADIDYLVNKIVHLRVFEDGAGKMNLSLKEIEGQVLSISQFTLYADTKKGRRPSFIDAAKPDVAEDLYEQFNATLRNQGIHVETGEFGADMDVKLTNDGPVTILIDSKNK